MVFNKLAFKEDAKTFHDGLSQTLKNSGCFAHEICSLITRNVKSMWENLQKKEQRCGWVSRKEVQENSTGSEMEGKSIERGMSAAYFRFLPHGSPFCLSAFSLRANRCHLSINALCLKVSLHEYVQVCVLYKLTLPFCGSSCLQNYAHMLVVSVYPYTKGEAMRTRLANKGGNVLYD